MNKRITTRDRSGSVRMRIRLTKEEHGRLQLAALLAHTTMGRLVADAVMMRAATILKDVPEGVLSQLSAEGTAKKTRYAGRSTTDDAKGL